MSKKLTLHLRLDITSKLKITKTEEVRVLDAESEGTDGGGS